MGQAIKCQLSYRQLKVNIPAEVGSDMTLGIGTKGFTAFAMARPFACLRNEFVRCKRVVVFKSDG